MVNVGPCDWSDHLHTLDLVGNMLVFPMIPGENSCKEEIRGSGRRDPRLKAGLSSGVPTHDSWRNYTDAEISFNLSPGFQTELGTILFSTCLGSLGAGVSVYAVKTDWSGLVHAVKTDRSGLVHAVKTDRSGLVHAVETDWSDLVQVSSVFRRFLPGLGSTSWI